MNMTGNTILITGAGSGIGLALAREFARMDNQVIVAARSPDKLKAAEQRGLTTIPADVSDAASIQALATRVMQEFPNTNVVVHNAAISKREDLVQGGDSRLQEETVATNLLGPMRLTNALMPHLLKQRSAAVLIAASTRAGVAGTDLTRAPVAWRMAPRIAGAVGTRPGSPTPFAPNGPVGSGSSISSTSILGTSPMVGIR